MEDEFVNPGTDGTVSISDASITMSHMITYLGGGFTNRFNVNPGSMNLRVN